MTTQTPRVFTIAPDRPFLDVLAHAVLAGFPRADDRPPGSFDLARWTILLPTRRAARALEDIFFRLTGGNGLLLPKIKPIGDIDEDLLAPGGTAAGDMPEAISRPGQLLLLIDLIDDWASANPQTPLALEIAAAPHRAHGLAVSLAEFLDGLETEDIDASRIPELYDIESARHREAILEFLGIARAAYPARLNGEGLIGPQARRSIILRREAARLTGARPEAPFIAAGSTGTIPATRTLLKAIACLPNGAVVLPGLDLAMDELSWLAAEPTHPQFALKQLLPALGIARADVRELGDEQAGPRHWLGGELMRPAETAHLWRGSLSGHAGLIEKAMAGVELVETRNLQEEALVAALILRHCLETPGRTGCLVTPDRQLARRVKAELRRWNIEIDDSAGEPLIRHGPAALFNLLIETVLQGFSATSLAALLRHELCTFGESAEKARRATGILELMLLRAGTGAPAVGELSHALRSAAGQQDYKHLLTRPLTREDWDHAASHAARISAVLAPLQGDHPDSLGAHLSRWISACEAMAGDAFWAGEAGDMLREAITALEEQSHLLRQCGRPRAAAVVRHWLQSLPLRRQAQGETRLAILGLLEARLIRSDLVVLAGLNEGTWPGAADPGPWLNRPMRERLGMNQPEREIGQTAHDFIQAFGCNEVKLLWSKRSGDAPATPSRWILRLQMILRTANLIGLLGAASPWTALARRLAEPEAVTPMAMPKPKPPPGLRPRQLSVTRIETLLRDPYAIYARHVLKLQPLDPISTEPDPARRGIIFHAAIGDFLNAYPATLPAGMAEKIQGFGKVHFGQIAGYPGLAGFWWPRFVRISLWLAAEEPGLRIGVERIAAEFNGALSFDIGGEPFTLTCRADRIDLMQDGTARIIDYKTGEPPTARQVQSGLAPQLTLQAAMLEAGAFRDAGTRQTRKLAYIQLSGGEPAGEIRWLRFDGDVMDLAHEHLARLKVLLAAYARMNQAYLPRAAIEKEDDITDYDHLSRYREWALSGGAS